MRYMVFISLIVVLCMGMVIFCSPTTYANRSDCSIPQITQTPEITPSPLLQSSPSSTTDNDIFLNEIEPPSLLMTAPCNTPTSGKVTSQDGWIELYSTASSSIDLYTQFCDIDSGNGTNPFAIEQGTILPAHGFTVIYPYDSNIFMATLTPTLRFLCDGIIMDQTTVPTLMEGTSYARSVDGMGAWQITSQITENATNIPPQPTVTPTIKEPDNQTTRQIPVIVKSTQIIRTTPPAKTSALIPEQITQQSPTASEKNWKIFRFPNSTATAIIHATSNLQQQTRGSPSTNAAQPTNNILIDITGVFIIMITTLVIWQVRKTYRRLRENRKNDSSDNFTEG